MLLVLVPSATDVGLRFQLGLTLLVMLGVLLPFAPAGLAWIAFGIPVGFAQLVVLTSREYPQHDLLLLTWAMTMAGAALTAQWLKRALSNNLSLRHRADLSAKAQEQANAELNRSREQLRLALDAIDAGIADTNLITGERFFSARYLGILGHGDRDRFHKEHRLSDALHPEDRKRVMEARRRHTESRRCLARGVSPAAIRRNLRVGHPAWRVGAGQRRPADATRDVYRG